MSTKEWVAAGFSLAVWTPLAVAFLMGKLDVHTFIGLAGALLAPSPLSALISSPKAAAS